jgi:hypothetical protein
MALATKADLKDELRRVELLMYVYFGSILIAHGSAPSLSPSPWCNSSTSHTNDNPPAPEELHALTDLHVSPPVIECGKLCSPPLPCADNPEPISGAAVRQRRKLSCKAPPSEHSSWVWELPLCP